MTCPCCGAEFVPIFAPRARYCIWCRGYLADQWRLGQRRK